MLTLGETTTIFLGLGQLKGGGFKTLRELSGVDAIADGFSTEGASKFVRRFSEEVFPESVDAQVLRLGEAAAVAIRKRGIHLVRYGDAHYPNKFLDLNGAWLVSLRDGGSSTTIFSLQPSPSAAVRRTFFQPEDSAAQAHRTKADGRYSVPWRAIVRARTII